MLVLRCTPQLLRRLGKTPPTAVPESTTKLGDWYGTALQAGRRRYGLFISERTRLPIVLEAAELRRLSAALPERLGQVLAIAMAEVVAAPTRSRSLLGSLNDFVFMARARLISTWPVSPLDLSLDLAEVPVGPMTFARPCDATLEPLGRQAAGDRAARIELVVTAIRGRTTLCRRLDGGGWTSLRAPRFWGLVPGEIVVVHPAREWTDAGRLYVTGEIESERLDVKALRRITRARAS
jgi:hypothetical protein